LQTATSKRTDTGVIYEGVITTTSPDGSAHITPMGFRRFAEEIELAPFRPSVTLENLNRLPFAVINHTDDVRVVAGCLTGRRDWPVQRASRIAGWRLAGALAHSELEVVEIIANNERPRFRMAIRAEETHSAFAGFNRAQAAVIEAAILISRLDWLAPEKLAEEMMYLKIAIDKTAGERELTAWSWLLAAAAAHPRHHLRLD
jgi:uncharacterized protein